MVLEAQVLSIQLAYLLLTPNVMDQRIFWFPPDGSA